MNIVIRKSFLTEAELYRFLGAALAASKLFKDYVEILLVLEGTGPEFYAESWMRANLHTADESYKNLVMEFFLKMLEELSKGEDGEQ